MSNQEYIVLDRVNILSNQRICSPRVNIVSNQEYIVLDRVNILSNQRICSPRVNIVSNQGFNRKKMS